jgi:hypothetical protein
MAKTKAIANWQSQNSKGNSKMAKANGKGNSKMAKVKKSALGWPFGTRIH